MTEDKTGTKIDPLEMSPEQIRAESAQHRLPSLDQNLGYKYTLRQQGNQSNTSYQNYLFGSAGQHEKPAWSDSVAGRGAIRLISRGIFGAAAFTIGGRISRTQLMNYNPETVELSLTTLKEKPLQLLAKGFDVVFGKPIASMARTTAKWRGRDIIAQESAAWNAVNFRTKAYYHEKQGLLTQDGRAMNGRSLGAEMVAVSFDFAMSSIGDASIRNFFQMIDPNIHKTWMVNDQGKMAKAGEKSHFSGTKFMKSLGRSAWRVLSNNQGEDWAVALPYVYQMKAQRGLISHAYGKEGKGVKLVFDNNWNGGAFKVNKEGQIIGDYQMAGAIDLHARFVGYNVYTLMFREAYDAAGNNFKKWKASGYDMHLHMPKKFHPFDAAKSAVRYVVKSTIKANLYMNFATIPFWLIRTPQSKWRGALINQEAGHNVNAIVTKKPSNPSFGEAGNFTDVFNQDTAGGRIFPGAGEQKAEGYNCNTPIPNAFGPGGLKGPYDDAMFKNKNFKPGLEKVVSEHVFNPIGKVTYKMGSWATNLAGHLPKWMQNYIDIDEKSMVSKGGIKRSKAGRETFMRTFMDASLAYTPYMFLKAEGALMVDDHPKDGGPGKMDTAIYKFIDNVSALKPRATVHSVKEIYRLAVHADPNKAHRRARGAEPEDDDTKNAQIPTTMVETKGSKRHDPVELSNNPEAGSGDDGQEKTDRNWAESIAGRNLAAQFQPVTAQTRH